MRPLHSFAGLAAALLVVFMAITGAILSLQPALSAITAGGAGGLTDVAQLASSVSAALPDVERITRSASGTIVAYYTDAGAHQAAQIDAGTGAVMGAYQPSAFFSFVTELHRSLFFGEAGRAVAGVASLAISVLAASGLLLLVSRMGGWRRLFAPIRGGGMRRLHSRLARVAVVALALTALTGAYMSGVDFSLIPDGSSADGFGFAATPASTGDTPLATASLAALVDTPLADLRELIFPAAGDASDVFTLTTNAGQGFIDQATGAMLSFTPNSPWQQLYETIYLLHTGDGLPWLGLLLGAAALAVPAMAVSGIAIWYSRRRNQMRLARNSSWRAARTVILVGTESNATLGFAATLHAALVANGERVHTAPMNSVRVYPKATRLLVLAATYGEGGAPASARQFLSRLARLPRPPAADYAGLGFGDRSYEHYCAFAEAADAALAGKGANPLLEMTGIDRQSSQDFAAWGRRLGEVTGQALELVHVPVRPRTRELVLVEREDYGIEVQAPTAILRFAAAAARPSLWGRWLGRPAGLPRFAVGNLVGILPPGAAVPRYYSIASASRDGYLEICVRKRSGGLCSEFLHALTPGATVSAFIKPNPDFRPARGRRPMILIGAGSGVAPLAGFIRHNPRQRPAYLFMGARDEGSDFLYRQQLVEALDDGRLAGLEAAFSRPVGGQYVQDRLAARARLIRLLVEDGAQILVCGGLDMARGARAALDALLAPDALSTAILKAQGRYLEDAY